MTISWIGGFAAAVVLCACAGVDPAGTAGQAPAPVAAPASSPTAAGGGALPHYRCDQNIEFTVRFENDTAIVAAGARGDDVLLRDAGGATPQQTVYSNPRMRAEFGLGAAGRDALLHYAQPPLSVHCMRD